MQEAQWTSFIATFITQHHINKDRVSISIPREKVLIRFLRFPAAAKENLRKVLEYESPKYIPFDKEKMWFDYQVLKEENEWLYLIAVFVKKEDVDPYLNLLKKMGIQPTSIQVPSAAALNLFFYHERDKENEISVLLDVSEPFFEMNLIQEGEWKESFHLPLSPEGKEAKILQTFMQSGLNGDSLSKSSLFVYGLDAAEGTLPNFGETHFMQGVIPPPLDRIEFEEEESKPDYIYGSIGVPLRGLVKTFLGLNLLPLEMRKKVRQISKPLFAVFISVALILGFTWGLGVFVHYRSGLDVLQTEIKKRKPEVEFIEKLQKQKVELEKEVFELKKITSEEISKVEILQELTKILPDTAWIWNFKYSGKEIELSGFADSASDLIPLLDKSPLFEKVEFLSPVTKERQRTAGEEKEKERFKIKIRIEGRGGITG